MSQKEKLLVRIKNNPRAVRFEDLDQLLRGYGFECRRGKGDHCIYYRPGYYPITIDPRHSAVHPRAVKDVLNAIERIREEEG